MLNFKVLKKDFHEMMANNLNGSLLEIVIDFQEVDRAAHEKRKGHVIQKMPENIRCRVKMKRYFLLLMLLCLAFNVQAESVYIVAIPSSKNELVYQSVVSHGTVITKPNCGTKYQRIFTSPARVLGGTGTTLYGIAGINTGVADGGTYWVIYAEELTVNNEYVASSPYVMANVQIWCCTNDLCTND